MFKNSYQSGFLSLFYAIGSKPLQIWDQEVKEGHVKRVTDEDIQGTALELAAESIANVYIACPADPSKTLGIKLPFLTLLVKGCGRYFSFEVALLDDMNVRRRFRASNYQ
ncbi:cilia- and flagella-associated protein, partial [Raphidocelis subcapitata]